MRMFGNVVFSILIVFFIYFVVLFTPVVQAGDHEHPNESSRILVKFGKKTSPWSMAAIKAELKLETLCIVPKIRVHVLKVPEREKPAREIIDILRAHPHVAYVEQDFAASALYEPDDALISQQWFFSHIQAFDAWELWRGDPSVVIAILDTGVDHEHPDLQECIIPGWNFDVFSSAYNTSNADDDSGHGTHVAGIAAALTDNYTGISSVAFEASILPVKVLDAEGNGYYSAVASGIIWAADHGAKVINLSLGGTSVSSTLQDAVNYANIVGALVIAAAGNSGDNTIYYPAGCENAMAIGATDQSDQIALFSSYGAIVSVVAPGMNILSTFWNADEGSTYVEASGTSQAAPMVSGLAALLFSQDLSRTNDIVRNIIERSADDIGPSGWDTETGHGRINAYSAFVGDLTGIVSDLGTSGPIPYATVIVFQDEIAVASAEADLDGFYQIPNLPSGTYDLKASAEGYEPVMETGFFVSPAEDNELDFALGLLGTISGKVYTKKRPIAGATVEAKQGEVTVCSTISDSSGNYILLNLNTGNYDVTASADGYESKTEEGVTVYLGNDTSGIDFNLAKTKPDNKPPRPKK